MYANMPDRKITVIFNIVFWLIYFLYEWLGLAALYEDFRGYFINACMALPLALVVSYITVHVLLKKYYDKWPRWKFWTLQLFISIALLLVRRTINYYLIYPLFFPFALQVAFFSPGKLIVEFVNLYLVVGVYTLFYFIQYWYEERQRVQALVQEKTLAELELLKSQVHPHFIFNTLNNIYSLALKSSPDAAKLISHLSTFLNYSLYESKQQFVPLSSEILYIKNYIELQKNRYGNRIDVSVNIYDDVCGLTIAPLLLLPLVENCFKHGIADSLDSGWIRVDISRQTDKLIIKIENSVDRESKLTLTKPGGIGISNVKKRLELLYPDKHEFTVLEEQNTHLVILKISITS
jgi:hypothetical protein